MQSALPWLMATGAYALWLALGPRLLSDPDTYSHIALGRWILDHHIVPTTDPFSANFRGANWVAFECFSQIAFAGAHAVGGWLGVVALTAAAVAAALGLLTRFLALSQVRHADLLGMLAPIFLARPLAEQFKAIAADAPVSPTRHRALLPIAALAVLVGTAALASLRGIAPAVRITRQTQSNPLSWPRQAPCSMTTISAAILILSASHLLSTAVPNSTGSLHAPSRPGAKSAKPSGLSAAARRIPHPGDVARTFDAGRWTARSASRVETRVFRRRRRRSHASLSPLTDNS
jgi:hypothetical protein